VPDNGTQSSLSWSFSTGLHQLCVVVGRLLGEFVVSWLMGIFVDKDRNDCRVHSVSVSIHLRSLRRICADQWYPVVIPLNRMYQLCIMPREVFFVQYLSLKDSGACKKQIKQKNISFETL